MKKHFISLWIATTSRKEQITERFQRVCLWLDHTAHWHNAELHLAYLKQVQVMNHLPPLIIMYSTITPGWTNSERKTFYPWWCLNVLYHLLTHWHYQGAAILHKGWNQMRLFLGIKFFFAMAFNFPARKSHQKKNKQSNQKNKQITKKKPENKQNNLIYLPPSEKLCFWF